MVINGRGRLARFFPSAYSARLQNNQRNPGCKLHTGSWGRRVSPRKVFVVEIDGGEIVRLKIGNACARFRADDGSRIDAENIAWTVK